MTEVKVEIIKQIPKSAYRPLVQQIGSMNMSPILWPQQKVSAIGSVACVILKVIACNCKAGGSMARPNR